MLASLPMYGVSREQTEGFWRILREMLRSMGYEKPPASLTHPQDMRQLWKTVCSDLQSDDNAEARDRHFWSDGLRRHWEDPKLLFSQTCGYTAVTNLRHLQLVGTYHYRVEGCDGPAYSSVIVARSDDPGTRLEDFRGRTVAYNSRDSHSGYNCLRAMIAPLARDGRFFRQARASGAHHHSLQLVRLGFADLAAIDSVSLALLERASPGAVAGLKIIGRSAPVPGPPLITAADTTPEQLAMLRAATQAMVELPVSRDFFIGGFSLVPHASYDVILEQQKQAEHYGVTDL